MTFEYVPLRDFSCPMISSAPAWCTSRRGRQFCAQRRPVLSVIPYDGVDDAVAIANDSEFGLGGSVWTNDHDRGEAVARRVQTGTIGINQYAIDPVAPFGGVKASGLGRELGPEGLTAYLQLQSIYEAPPAQAAGAP